MNKNEGIKPMSKEPLGSPVVWLKKFHEGIEKGEVTVPCGTCDACCRDFDEIFLTNEEKDKYEHTVNEKGRAVLARGDDQCFYLGRDGCSTYNDRPLNCRQFDCRALAHCGLFPMDFPRVNAAVQHWDPTFKTEEEKVLGMALRLAARASVESGKDSFQASAQAVFGGFGMFAREAVALIRKAVRRGPEIVGVDGKPLKKR